ncbi:hypothetical protein CALCODRAFT_254043 [Calocera cornea HHB12733]|uniref:Uncharacterized protein n=1 Tax=Calocera cornea HHB12733 TaxID=1353952 RepID=A0A165GM02_9BASI|nr:hypothetical protein CALCODRAFT_254043 [Calocera cornea HHB12733]
MRAGWACRTFQGTFRSRPSGSCRWVSTTGCFAASAWRRVARVEGAGGRVLRSKRGRRTERVSPRRRSRSPRGWRLLIAPSREECDTRPALPARRHSAQNAERAKGRKGGFVSLCINHPPPPGRTADAPGFPRLNGELLLSPACTRTRPFCPGRPALTPHHHHHHRRTSLLGYPRCPSSPAPTVTRTTTHTTSPIPIPTPLPTVPIPTTHHTTRDRMLSTSSPHPDPSMPGQPAPPSSAGRHSRLRTSRSAFSLQGLGFTTPKLTSSRTAARFSTINYPASSPSYFPGGSGPSFPTAPGTHRHGRVASLTASPSSHLPSPAPSASPSPSPSPTLSSSSALPSTRTSPNLRFWRGKKALPLALEVRTRERGTGAFSPELGVVEQGPGPGSPCSIIVIQPPSPPTPNPASARSPTSPTTPYTYTADADANANAEEEAACPPSRSSSRASFLASTVEQTMSRLTRIRTRSMSPVRWAGSSGEAEAEPGAGEGGEREREQGLSKKQKRRGMREQSECVSVSLAGVKYMR